MTMSVNGGRTDPTTTSRRFALKNVSSAVASIFFHNAQIVTHDFTVCSSLYSSSPSILGFIRLLVSKRSSKKALGMLRAFSLLRQIS